MTERGRIALFLTNQQNEYLRMVADDAIAAGSRADLKVEVKYADNQAIAQIQQIHACLREEGALRARSVLVMPVADESLARVARAAVTAGVGWVSLFRRSPYVDELRRIHPQIPIFVSSPDQDAVGRIQGRQIRALRPRGGNVLFVKGMASSSSTQERFAATRQELTGSGIEIVGEVDGNWAENVAAQGVERWLRLLGSFKDKRIDLVVCQSDSMARGAVRALKSSAASLGLPDLGRVPVLGADGLPGVGRKMVDERALAATIVLPSPAAPAVRALERALFQGVTAPPEILLPPSGYPDEAVLANAGRTA
jgi:ABC-type sugar transport system substrate-binding protein